jgi:hypothetical protein
MQPRIVITKLTTGLLSGHYIATDANTGARSIIGSKSENVTACVSRVATKQPDATVLVLDSNRLVEMKG